MQLGTHTWLIEVFGTSFMDENIQTGQLHIKAISSSQSKGLAPAIFNFSKIIPVPAGMIPVSNWLEVACLRNPGKKGEFRNLPWFLIYQGFLSICYNCHGF